MTKTGTGQRQYPLPKKLLSLFLAAAMVLPTLLFFNAGFGLTAKAEAAQCGDLKFIVPEAIYLYPNATAWKDATSTPFQYYINNNSSGSPLNSLDTTGKIYYTYSGASTATLSYQFFDSSLSSTLSGSATLSSSTISSGSSVNITGGSSPSLAAATTGCYIRWQLSYTDRADDTAKKAYAWTYVYKPYTVPAGVLLDVKDKYGPHYNKQISWMVGFHGMTDGNSGNNDGLYYPKYTGEYGLAVFASPNNKAYIGTTEVTNGSNTTQRDISNYTTTDNTTSYTGEVKKAGATRWYLLFTGTGTGTYHFKSTASNNDDQDWFKGSNNASETYPYPFVQGDDTDKDKNHIMTATARYRGTITIDTSRYSNLIQVPNLSVGLFVVSDESSSSGGSWFVADMTDRNQHIGNQYANFADNANKFNDMRNYIIAGQFKGRTDMDYNESEGVRYAGPWYRPIISGSSKEYIAHTMYANWYDGVSGNDYYVFTHGEISLHATQYDKSALRAAVQNAIKMMPVFNVTGDSNGSLSTNKSFSGTTWSTFQSAYKNAVMALTKVDGTITAPATLATNLNNAVDALTSQVTNRGHVSVEIPAVSATCTAAGNNKYYQCKRCLAYFSDAACTTPTTVAAQTVAALGHNTSSTWTKDSTHHWKVCTRCGTIQVAKVAHSGGTATCTAAKVCAICGASYGGALGHDWSSTANADHLKTAATCTTAAVYYKWCTRCGANSTETFSSGSTLGHQWGTPTYSWSSDNSQVTATRVCSRNSAHVETETVNTTSSVVTNATCEGQGSKKYTATFTNTAFSTQTKTVAVNALGHSWGTPTYTWSTDNSQVTATRVCGRDSNHVQTETVNTTATVVTAATCEGSGTTKYTATFANSAFATQTKNVTVGALGHSWGAPTYTWSSDNTTVTATRVCGHNSSHTQTETVSVTYADSYPNCTSNGTRTYTSAAFTNSAFTAQTKTASLTPQGHNLTSWASANGREERYCQRTGCTYREYRVTGTFNYMTGTGSATSTSPKVTGTSVPLSVTIPSAPASVSKNSKSYSLQGWSTGNNLNNTVAATGSVSLNANATYYAVYQVPLTLSYNANGGSNAPASHDVTGKSNYNASTYSGSFTVSSVAPTRDGYTFLGWSTDQNATTASISAGGSYTASALNTTLYAVWQERSDIQYKVNHYQQNVTGTGYTLKETTTYNDGHVNGSITLADKQKTYTGFTYQYGTLNGNTTHVTTAAIAANGSLQVNLYYDRVTTTVTPAAGTGVASVSGGGTIRYEGTGSVTATVKPGYTFENWTSSNTAAVAGGTGATYSYTANATGGSATLTANARANTNTAYTVYYYLTNMEDDKLATSKILALDGVQPSNETIGSGEYGLTNDFYVVIRKDAAEDSPERVLYNWICSAQGKELVEKENYVAK